jgi:hypothetical protein
MRLICTPPPLLAVRHFIVGSTDIDANTSVKKKISACIAQFKTLQHHARKQDSSTPTKKGGCSR